MAANDFRIVVTSYGNLPFNIVFKSPPLVYIPFYMGPVLTRILLS